MSTIDFHLAKPPSDPRARELWLQQAAAFILFENVRKYAIDRVDRGASAETRAAAVGAIDDAMFGLMKFIDGENWIAGADGEVDLKMVVRLKAKGDRSGEAIQELDLSEGDGFCMGFHEWKEGVFGEEPVVASRRK